MMIYSFGGVTGKYDIFKIILKIVNSIMIIYYWIYKSKCILYRQIHQRYFWNNTKINQKK